MRARGLLKSVRCWPPPAKPKAGSRRVCPFDEFAVPDISAHELVVRIRLCFARCSLAVRDNEAEVPSEFSFRTMAESSTDIVARYDRDQRYIFVNAAIYRVTGIPADQLLGKTHREAGFDPDHADFWDASIHKTFVTGESARVEYSFLTPDGPRYFESVQAPNARPMAASSPCWSSRGTPPIV